MSRKKNRTPDAGRTPPPLAVGQQAQATRPRRPGSNMAAQTSAPVPAPWWLSSYPPGAVLFPVIGSLFVFLAPVFGGYYNWQVYGAFAAALLLLAGIRLLLLRGARPARVTPAGDERTTPVFGDQGANTSSALPGVVPSRQSLPHSSPLPHRRVGEGPGVRASLGPAFWLLLLYAVIQALSLFVSVNRDASLKALATTLAAAALVLLLSPTADPGAAGVGSTPARWVCLAGPAAAVFAAVLWVAVRGIREYAQNHAFDPGSRVFSTFFNPDITAGFLGMALLVCFSLLWLELPRLGVLVVGLAAVLGSITLALTGSKGGWLAFGIGLFVMGIGRKMLPAPARARTMVMVLLLSLAAAGACSRMLIGRIESAGGTEAHSMEFRKLVWESAAHMMAARPVLGFGAGTFADAYPRFAIAGPTLMAHSSFLQAGAESGAPGMVVLLLAAAAVFVPVWSLRRRHLRETSPAVTSPATVAAPLEENRVRFQRLVLALSPGLAGAVAVSAVHNVIDFDWAVPGVWLVFWGLATSLWNCAEPADGAATAASLTRPSLPLVAGVLSLVAAAACTVSAMGAAYVSSAESAIGAGGPGSDSSAPDPQAAIAAATAGIRLDPLDPGAWLARGRARQVMAATDPGSAEAPSLLQASAADLTRASQLDTMFALPLYLRAGTLQALGDLPAAAASDRLAIGRDPHVLDAMLQLAVIDISLRRTGEARLWLQRAASTESTPYAEVQGVPEEFDPHYLDAWRGLLRLDIEAADWNRALIDGQHALADLDAYARRLVLHWKYQQVWKIYDPAHRQQMLQRENDTVNALRVVLQHLGRTSEDAALGKQQEQFNDALAVVATAEAKK